MIKKSLFITLFILSIFSCATTNQFLVFPQENGETLNFIRFDKTSDKSVLLFNCDFTVYSDNSELTKNSVFNYSLCIKNKSKKELERLRLVIETDNEFIETKPIETFYFDYYKRQLLIRKSVEISTIDTVTLLNSQSNIKVHLYDNEIKIHSFILPKSYEKLSEAKLLIL